MAVEVTVHFAGALFAQTVVGPDDDYRIGTGPDIDLAVPGFTSFPIVDRGGVIRVPVGVPSVGGSFSIGLVRIAIAPAAPPVAVPRPRHDFRPAPYIAAVFALHVIGLVLAFAVANPPAIIPPAPIQVIARIAPTTPLPPPPPLEHPKRKASGAKTPHGAEPQPAAGMAVDPVAAARDSAVKGSYLASDALGPGIMRLMGTVDIKHALDDVYPLYVPGDEYGPNSFGGRAGNFDPTSRPEFASVKTGAYQTIAHGRAAGEDFDVGGGHAVDVSVCGSGCVAAGAIDRHAVTSWIAPHVDELRACYLDSKAGGGGSVMVSFTIGGDGVVHGAGARGLSGVAPCVAGVVASIAFPRTDQPTRVRYPIVFTAKG